MNLTPIFKNISEAYVVKRTVDFDTLGIKVSLQTLTALEEVKVLESCKELEGAQYLQALKRNSLAYAIRGFNDIELGDEITTDAGTKMSKFLFLCEQFDKWPSAIRDILFTVFTDMSQEMEKKVSDSVKFTPFAMSAPDFKEAKPMFRRIDEPESQDEAEILKKKVEEEITTEDAKIQEGIRKQQTKV